jgi:hypothetical protein
MKTSYEFLEMSLNSVSPSYTNPNKFIFKFSSSQPSPAGEGIYENLLGLVLSRLLDPKVVRS